MTGLRNGLLLVLPIWAVVWWLGGWQLMAVVAAAGVLVAAACAREEG